MRPDEDLLKEITQILEFDPGIDATNIFVEVEEGIVTLSGSVHSDAAKWMAKEAVKHISGIRSIIVELEVRPLIKE
ncbi:MAG: BON domain-containing protein [Alphaproteobacteria bacterium]|nr:BON domain-containing protein [Alphaproteobacteria bacterium]